MKMSIKYDKLLNLKDEIITENKNYMEEILEYEDILFEISKVIIKYRKENNLTQKALAEILTVNQVMISKLESGNYNPTFKQIHKISRKLTNSANLFTMVLQNIIDNMKLKYSIIYDTKISENDIKDENILFYSNYKYTNAQKGGFYGKEKCTSQFSIAG